MFFRSNLLSVSFHPDETFWIVSTNTRFDEFIKGNFLANVWSESFESFRSTTYNKLYNRYWSEVSRNTSQSIALKKMGLDY